MNTESKDVSTLSPEAMQAAAELTPNTYDATRTAQLYVAWVIDKHFAALRTSLQWAFDNADLKPFNASLDETNQVSTWKCWGCGGEFESRWPQWVEPTDETFPHASGCKYVCARAFLNPS